MTTENPDSTAAQKPNNVLVLSIKDKDVLYAAYMGFLKEGGLFIPTQRPFVLGQEVPMHINLMDDPEKQIVTGRVVWITPTGAQGSKAPGIGLEFTGPTGKVARDKIETYLAGMQNSDKQTHTL